MVTSNVSSSTATSPDKAAYSMLKHLPRSGMDYFLHIFNLSWTLHSLSSISKTSSIIPIHSFSSISETSSIIPIHKMESLSTLLLPSGLSLSPPVYQDFLNASYYPVYFSFWNLIPFSVPAKPVSALVGLL